MEKAFTPPPFVNLRNKTKVQNNAKNNFFQGLPSKISYMTQLRTYKSYNLPNVGILW